MGVIKYCYGFRIVMRLLYNVIVLWQLEQLLQNAKVISFFHMSVYKNKEIRSRMNSCFCYSEAIIQFCHANYFRSNNFGLRSPEYFKKWYGTFLKIVHFRCIDATFTFTVALVFINSTFQMAMLVGPFRPLNPIIDLSKRKISTSSPARRANSFTRLDTEAVHNNVCSRNVCKDFDTPVHIEDCSTVKNIWTLQYWWT